MDDRTLTHLNWRSARVLPLVCLAAMNILTARTAAHDTYTLFVQHRIDLVIGADRLDVTVDLTFFEEWSLRERRRMDANEDEHLSKTEEKAYLDQIAPELSSKVRLLVSGREIPLAPLYEPELDLLGNRRARPGHHRLKLFFFAPVAPVLRAGDELVLKDSLWREARMLVTFELEALDGGVFEPLKRRSDGLGSAEAGREVSLSARCVTPPKSRGTAN